MVKNTSKRVTRTVDKVIDGDTFRTKRKVNGSHYVRIANLDTPEKGKKGYKTASNALKKEISGKKVSITSKGTSYGRTVAKVTQNRSNISKSMSKYSKK